MPSDLFPFSTEAIIGGCAIAGWEIIKAIAGAIWQKRGDKAGSAKSLARSDIEQAQRDATDCLKKAIQFFTDDIEDAARPQLARAIQHDIKCIATRFFTLDGRMKKLRAKQLDQNALVRFRQCLTLHLDDRGAYRLLDSDPKIVLMYQAHLELQEVLDSSRYALT